MSILSACNWHFYNPRTHCRRSHSVESLSLSQMECMYFTGSPLAISGTALSTCRRTNSNLVLLATNPQYIFLLPSQKGIYRIIGECSILYFYIRGEFRRLDWNHNSLFSQSHPPLYLSTVFFFIQNKALTGFSIFAVNVLNTADLIEYTYHSNTYIPLCPSVPIQPILIAVIY